MTTNGKKQIKLPPLLPRSYRLALSSQSKSSQLSSGSSTASTRSLQTRPGSNEDGLDRAAESLMQLCKLSEASHICRYNKIRRANDILIDCMVKKTVRERQAIQSRFNQLYSLDLETRLKETLSPEFAGIISGLLQSPYRQAAVEFHQVIEDLDPYLLVDRLMLNSRKTISLISAEYKKHFRLSLSADIQRSFGDRRVSRLLTALVRGLQWPAAFTADAVAAAAKEADSQETTMMEETGVLLVGLQKYGPSFLLAVSDAHREANQGSNGSNSSSSATSGSSLLLRRVKATYDAGFYLLVKKLLDPADGAARIRELAAELGRLAGGGGGSGGGVGRELVHQILTLAESPRVLRAVNRQLLTTREASLRDLVLRQCPRDCADIVACLLASGGGGAGRQRAS